MEKYRSVLPSLLSSSLLLLFFFFFHGNTLVSAATGTADGSEEWGYVQVRPKAHMFWWLYRSPQRVDNPSTPWPIVLWLQGGPGASGVGVGNFQEIGPLDTHLKPRNSTWLQKADLLFVDNPVGTGYSFVENTSLLVKTDEEAATDLTTLLKEVFNGNEELQKSPLYIVAESYGGKFAVTVGLSVEEAIKTGELKLKLGGIALGDSWISPEDFVFSWGPLLADVSRLDRNGLEKSNRMAIKIKQQIQNGNYSEATNSWGDLELMILNNSNNVDFYNFLLDYDMDPLSATVLELNSLVSANRYSRYLSDKISSTGGLNGLMNTAIKEKLKIIPENVSWGGQSSAVFDALAADFMKPRIDEVDELLSRGINLTVYNGQVDLICATRGTEAWIRKLKWDGLENFTSVVRTPLYCSSESGGGTKGFTKSYKNLHFYWILGAGHFMPQEMITFPIMWMWSAQFLIVSMLLLVNFLFPNFSSTIKFFMLAFKKVPVDQPCIALKMLGDITQSPASVHLSAQT